MLDEGPRLGAIVTVDAINPAGPEYGPEGDNYIDNRDQLAAIPLVAIDLDAQISSELVSRGQDDESTIKRRMQKSWDEISHWDGYDFVLVNDDLDATEAQLRTILTATRLRRSQQPGLTNHVRKLQTEFEEKL